MLVAIPSKGRAGSVKTLKVLPSGTLFIPKSEASNYRDIYPDAEIALVPGDNQHQELDPGEYGRPICGLCR